MKVQLDIDDIELPWECWLSFVGQGAAHNFFIHDLISRNMARYPGVHSIVELGTYRGALTMYLGLWGLRLGIPVHTFDYEPALSAPVHHVFEKLGVITHWCDMYTEEGIAEVMKAVGDKPTYLICDGGDKPKEFDLFGQLIPVGSMMSAHDWGTEIKEIYAKNVLFEHLNTEEWAQHDAKWITVVKIGMNQGYD